MQNALTLVTILTSFYGYCQCNLNEILPFKLGSDKFTIVQKGQGFIEELSNDKTYGLANKWEKYDYLKNDSVYISHINYDVKKNNCFNGKTNHFYLRLADDHLIRMELTMRFNASDYSQMLTQYKFLLSLFNEAYQVSVPFKSTHNQTNEKTGQGFWFSHEKQMKKSEEASVGYRVEYKTNYSIDKGFVETNEPEFYEIEISITDLTGTKLTDKGF